MVESGNHQGRPPGGRQPLLEMGSDLSSVSLRSSVLDHWINQDIASLDFLDGFYTLNSGRTNDASSFPDASQNCTSVKAEASNVGALEAEKLYMYQGKDSYHPSSGLPLWGFPMDIDSLKLDEVFQVEQSDLVQSPTLAELNSEKEPLFELEFSDFDDMQYILPDIIKDVMKEVATKDTVTINVPSEVSVKLESKVAVPKSEPHSTATETQSENFAVESERSSVSRVKVENSSPLAIPGMSVRSRTRTISSTELSVTSSVSSNDEGFGSQAEDTDAELQLASDNESLICDDESLEGSPLSPGSSSRCRSESSSSVRSSKVGVQKKRYFWQYNIQSKGPKGPRLPMNSAQLLDPHILNDVTDPVFSTECHLEGVKHAGKARRGDGNDLTPNPLKLHNIGVELKALNKMINELSTPCDSPASVKPKSRKEKNKLASRSCRLKKKAQHEANKLKLFGLQQEHTQLMNIMGEVKMIVHDFKRRGLSLKACQQTVQKVLERKVSAATVAGHTAEYVNSVLDKIAAGHAIQGLDG